MPLNADENLLGCNAKLGAGNLLNLMTLDFEELGNDNGRIELEGVTLVQSIDTVYPFVNDIDLFVKVSILHCINDIACSGAKPLAATLSLGIGLDLTLDELKHLSSCCAKEVASVGVDLVNIHTFVSERTSITLSVTAIEGLVKPVQGSEFLVYISKPLSSVNTLFLSDRDVSDVCLQSSIPYAEIINKYCSELSTDISGFGFLGHAAIAAQQKALEMNFQISSIPYCYKGLDLELLCSAQQNQRDFSKYITNESQINAQLVNALYGGETNGPLLIFVPKEFEATVAKLALEQSLPMYLVGDAIKSDNPGVVIHE